MNIHDQIDAAAKVLAEGMDYPWDYMPEQGRKTMRALVVKVVNATQPAVQGLPDSYKGSVLTTIDADLAKVSFLFSKPAEAEEWHARITAGHNIKHSEAA